MEHTYYVLGTWQEVICAIDNLFAMLTFALMQVGWLTGWVTEGGYGRLGL